LPVEQARDEGLGVGVALDATPDGLAAADEVADVEGGVGSDADHHERAAYGECLCGGSHDCRDGGGVEGVSGPAAGEVAQLVDEAGVGAVEDVRGADLDGGVAAGFGQVDADDLLDTEGGAGHADASEAEDGQAAAGARVEDVGDRPGASLHAAAE